MRLRATLPFTEFDFMAKYSKRVFAVSELGRIHAQLPLKELAREKRSHFPKTHPQGKHAYVPAEERVPLMFLKSYTEQSDDGLIEMLNGTYTSDVLRVLIDPAKP